MKKYTFKHDAFSDCYCDIEEDKNGEWVKYEDVKELQESSIMLRRIIQHSSFKQEVDKLFEGIEK